MGIDRLFAYGRLMCGGIDFKKLCYSAESVTQACIHGGLYCLPTGELMLFTSETDTIYGQLLTFPNFSHVLPKIDRHYGVVQGDVAHSMFVRDVVPVQVPASKDPVLAYVYACPSPKRIWLLRHATKVHSSLINASCRE